MSKEKDKPTGRHATEEVADQANRKTAAANEKQGRDDASAAAAQDHAKKPKQDASQKAGGNKSEGLGGKPSN